MKRTFKDCCGVGIIRNQLKINAVILTLKKSKLFKKDVALFIVAKKMPITTLTNG